jgi:hypothetical protein
MRFQKVSIERLRAARVYAFVLAFAAAILYGATYQQFRFFNLDDPGGASDAVDYVEMSKRNFEIGFHRYRWMTPTAAMLVRHVLEGSVRDQALAVKLSFYIVNFAFSLGACVALFALLQAIGFSVPLALLGICAFASSRITVLATATPLVDAAYFCAVTTLLYLIVARKGVILAMSLPIIVISKETILPFLLLPLLTELRRSRAYMVGLAAAALTFATSIYIMNMTSAGPSYAETVFDQFDTVRSNIEYLFSLQGVHDLQNGFSFFLIFAAHGAFLNRKYHLYVILRALLATIPIGLAYAVLNGNLGRMFFVAFPAIIAFALVLIDYVSLLRQAEHTSILESSDKGRSEDRTAV